MLTKKNPIKNEVKNSKTAKNTPSHENHPHTPSNNCCHTIHKKTCITIKYNAGYSNQLYIRGQGAHLSWEKGQLLKNTQADEWTWETDVPFTHCEFKILMNDSIYENGDNHLLNAGSNTTYTPHF